MGESRSFGFTCCWIPGIVNAAHVDLRSLLMQVGSPLCYQDPDAHHSGHQGPGLGRAQLLRATQLVAHVCLGSMHLLSQLEHFPSTGY